MYENKAFKSLLSMKTECWIKIYPCGCVKPHGYAFFVTSPDGSEGIRLIELPVHALKLCKAQLIITPFKSNRCPSGLYADSTLAPLPSV